MLTGLKNFGDAQASTSLLAVRAPSSQTSLTSDSEGDWADSAKKEQSVSWCFVRVAACFADGFCDWSPRRKPLRWPPPPPLS